MVKKGVGTTFDYTGGGGSEDCTGFNFGNLVARLVNVKKNTLNKDLIKKNCKKNYADKKDQNRSRNTGEDCDRNDNRNNDRSCNRNDKSSGGSTESC